MGRRTIEEIRKGVEEFKKELGLEKVIIFGSYARGDPNEHSDLDLILVGKCFEGKSFHERFRGLWLRWKLSLPVDFLCYTPEEFEELRERVSIVSDALSEGIEI